MNKLRGRKQFSNTIPPQLNHPVLRFTWNNRFVVETSCFTWNRQTAIKSVKTRFVVPLLRILSRRFTWNNWFVVGKPCFTWNIPRNIHQLPNITPQRSDRPILDTDSVAGKASIPWSYDNWEEWNGRPVFVIYRLLEWAFHAHQNVNVSRETRPAAIDVVKQELVKLIQLLGKHGSVGGW